MSIASDIRRLEVGDYISLFSLDATELGGEVLHFHPHTTLAAAPILFGGVSYAAFPIQITGFERTVRGTLPRPQMAVSNIGSAISSILRVTDDLVGAKVTRIRTLGRYLDGQPGADPAQHLPLDIFYVDHKVSETKRTVIFELAAALDLEGLMLPRRQIVANACRWGYRGPDCGYAGPPRQRGDGSLFGPTTDAGAWSASTGYTAGQSVWQLVRGVRVYYVARATVPAGTPLADTTKWDRDVCFQKSLGSCKVHFGANEPLPAGLFPGVANIRRLA